MIKLLLLIPIMILLIVGCSKEQTNSSKQPLRISTRQPIVFYVDFSKPSTEKRFFIKQGDVVLYATYVAHGAGSGKGIYATRFSNEYNSYCSSLGRYKVLYQYKGKHGMSLKIEGLDKTDDNAYARDVVIHSAKYIGYDQTHNRYLHGHSLGCFAVPEEAMPIILHYARLGTILIATD